MVAGPYEPPATNLRLFAYAGQQVTTGRNFYNAPYRFIGVNRWDGSKWTLEPWEVPSWDALTASGRIFLRLVAVLPDGATSVAGYASANT
jgi:hypothetical protein